MYIIQVGCAITELHELAAPVGLSRVYDAQSSGGYPVKGAAVTVPGGGVEAQADLIFGMRVFCGTHHVSWGATILLEEYAAPRPCL